jgi:hypothetical protein
VAYAQPSNHWRHHVFCGNQSWLKAVLSRCQGTYQPCALSEHEHFSCTESMPPMLLSALPCLDCCAQLSHTIGMNHAGIGADMVSDGYGGWAPRSEYGGG